MTDTPTPMPGTALPWRDGDDGTIIAGHDGIGEPVVCDVTQFDHWKQDAAYIVWACNNAPALLSALERARETLVRIAGRDFDCMPHQHGMAAAGHAQTALHDVEAALTTAGGRNG